MAIDIAPGANLSDSSALFEATHGTAPDLAGQNNANPSSLILSAEVMLRHMGWIEVADLIIKGIAVSINSAIVTFDPSRLTVGVEPVSCSEFGDAIIERM